MNSESVNDIVERYHEACAQLYQLHLESKDMELVSQKLKTDEQFKPLLDALIASGYHWDVILDLNYFRQKRMEGREKTESNSSKTSIAENEAISEASSSVSAEAASTGLVGEHQRAPADSLISPAPCLHLEFSEERWKIWLIENEFDKDETKLKGCLAAYAKHHDKNSQDKLFADIVVDESRAEKHKLIPKPFVCKTKPDCIKIVQDSNLRHIDASSVILSIASITEIPSSTASGLPTRSRSAMESEGARNEAERKHEEISIRESLRWFGRFLKYQNATINEDRKFVPNLGLDEGHIAEAIELLSRELEGIDEVKRQMSVGFQLLQDTATLPRGVLLHGPPGTGKTSIVLNLNNLLGIQLVSGMLAAGDFAKPYVGHSEQMINQLAERAAKVPWRLCCLVVDEIESLVTKRDSTGQRGSDSSKLSVLLSRIGGVGDVPNLMFFACTNFPEQMDAAFMRRMKIKIFVGPPTRSGRAKFIHKLGAKIFGTNGHKCDNTGQEYDRGCTESGCKLEHAVVDLMLNYAGAQMMGALLRLKIVLRESNKGSIQHNFTDIRDALAQFSEEENILVSTYNPVTILAPVVRPCHHSAPSELIVDIEALESYFSPQSELTDDCSKRVLVDLTINHKQVQVELSRIVRTRAQEAFMKGTTNNGRSYLETLSDAVTSTSQLRKTLDALTLAFADSRRTNRLIEPYVKILELHLKLHEFSEMCRNPSLTDSQQMEAVVTALSPKFGRSTLMLIREQPSQNNHYLRELIATLFSECLESGRALRKELESRFGENIRREGYKYFDLARKSSDITLEELLGFLFQLGNVSDASRVLLICPEFFHANGVSNEGEMELLFHQQINMLRNSYKSGFVIIDLDALTLPQVPAMGQGSMDNSKLFTTIMVAMHTVPSSGIWFVAFSRNPHVMRRVREYHSWRQVEDPDPQDVCYNCGKHVRRSQNRNDACGKHSGALILYESVSKNDSGNPPISERVRPGDYRRRKEIIQDVNEGKLNWKQLKWSCCDVALFCSHGGELQSEHDFGKVAILDRNT